MFWFDRGGLDAAAYAALAQHVGRRHPQVLASATTADGFAAALPDRLIVRDGEHWSETPWMGIIQGGWNADAQAFTWTCADNSRGSVAVTRPGGLPRVFRERVNSSIVVNHHMREPECRGITIIGRRAPQRRDDALVWQVVSPDGPSPEDPAAAPLVATQLQRLRAEYDSA